MTLMYWALLGVGLVVLGTFVGVVVVVREWLDRRKSRRLLRHLQEPEQRNRGG